MQCVVGCELYCLDFTSFDMGEIPDSKISLDLEVERAIAPKAEPEILDFVLPYDNMWPRGVGDNVASSSGSNLRSSLIGMGFLPSLVDKAIEEKGEDDADLLVETLFAYSDLHKSDAESSDSLDGLFDDKDANSPPEVSAVEPKEEPDVFDGINEDKRASLLMMNFSINEVDFAIDKLGEDAPIDEIVDFVIAAQIAEKYEKKVEGTTLGIEESNEDVVNETLYGTMDKTLCLLQMGFTENQVSAAIEKFGPDVPISELADAIFAGQIADDYLEKDKKCGSSGDGSRHRPYGSVRVKTEDPLREDFNEELNRKGKIPKQECFDDNLDASSLFRVSDFDCIRKGKRLKQDYLDDSSSCHKTARLGEKVSRTSTRYEVPSPFKSGPCKTLDRMVAKPPYFFYGSVVNISSDSWAKVSQFLYAVVPEFVNAQFFSALIRKEGYVHNLPTENRFHIIPKPPMTIQDAVPHTKRWWPSWDTRKQLSCITSENSGISQLCDRLGRMLNDSRGLLSTEQQKDILHHCRALNLVWVGRHKLGPIEPEHLECILGYPLNHTQDAGISLIERLEALKHCFQTDTLGYHLSVLKSMYPDGLTMLSIFGGIGGAEVALHQLGIRLKGVVSVETSVTKRNILKRWWESTSQDGELVQLEDIEKLTSSRLQSLAERFGGFDFVICQSPCSSSSLTPKVAVADTDSLPGFDFSLFYEFVRVLQRVRSMPERRR